GIELGVEGGIGQPVVFGHDKCARLDSFVGEIRMIRIQRVIRCRVKVFFNPRVLVSAEYRLHGGAHARITPSEAYTAAPGRTAVQGKLPCVIGGEDEPSGIRNSFLTLSFG